MHERLRTIIRLSVAVADRRTHLLWLVSRSVVDTLYWTETVTTSRLNVVDDADVVWVLIWLVEYSRGVVYVTELISVTESKRVKKNMRQGAASLRSIARRGWYGRKVEEVEEEKAEEEEEEEEAGSRARK